MKKGEGIKLVAGFIICILAFLLCYLFALNGRYIKYGNTGIYDKWKNEAYTIGSEEIPYILNGVDIYKKGNNAAR